MLTAGAVLGAFLAAAAVLLAGDALPTLGLSGPQRIAIVLTLPLLYLLCVAAHEAGHVLAGMLVGFRPLLVIAGPLRIERRPAGVAFGLNRSVLLSGGLAAAMPVGTHDLRRRTLVMVAGGPLASLVVGVQCLGIWIAASPFLLSASAPVAARFVAVALLFLGMASLLLGLVSVLPARTGGFYSDGARMLRLLRSGPDVDGEVALLALTGLSLGGTRPRDWDAALVARSAAVRDGGPFEVGGLHFAYAHALDRGDIPAARAYLRDALDRLPQVHAGGRASLLLAAATFFALFENDAQRARSFLVRAAVPVLLAAPHQRLLAESAVRFAEKDLDGARAAAHAAQRLAAHALDRGGAALDHELAGRILLSAENAVR